MLIATVGLVAGLGVLTVAADRLVASAAGLSRLLGISPVLIGAIIIGLGTSVPELVVSAISGDIDLAMGNVVGSNVSNVTLVLGAAALVLPITTQGAVLRREGLLMLVAVAGLAAVLADRDVSRVEGVVLVAGMGAAYLAILRWSMASPDYQGGSIEAMSAPLQLFWAGVVSLLFTVGAAWLLVLSARELADELGLTNAFVGLIILAVGTSLPELATTLAAARRSEVGLVVGNVLGSNLFNSLAVAGVVGLVYPGRVSGDLVTVSVLMLATALVAGVFITTNRRVSRTEGMLLLVGFIVMVVLSA